MIRGQWTNSASVLGLILMMTACGATESSTPDFPRETGAASPEAQAPSFTASPSIEPVVGDGEAWIAYQWVAPHGDGIFLIRPDGTDHHQLVPDMTGSEIHPDWSPDGSQIAFVRQTPEGPTELWVANADGTDATHLHTCEFPCNEIHYPDWSPGGTSIYFSQSADVPPGEVAPSTFSIVRLTIADGSVDVIVSRGDGVEVWQARVSPDGKTIAYAAGSEEIGGTAILTSPVEGGPPSQLTPWEMLAAHPDWTLDGRIVFHTHDLAIFPSTPDPADIFVMDADGGNLEQLTRFTGGVRAAQTRLTPDGSGITFTQVDGGGRRLAMLQFGDAEPTWLTPDALPGTHPHLRPQG